MKLTAIIIAAQLVSMVSGATGLAQTAPPLRVVSLGECRLSTGSILPNCRVAYRAYGRLNAAHDNAVLIPTWLLGRSEDWASLLNMEPLVDTTRFYTIVVDALSDGLSSSPSNTPGSGAVFRDLTVGDMVESQYRLLTERLGIHHVRAVIGFSMGGMQAIEWAVRYPSFVDRIVPIAGTPHVGAFNRLALTAMLDEIVNGRRAGIPPDSLWSNLARTEMLFVQTPLGLNARGADSVAHDIAVNARTYRAWDLNDYAAQIAALRRYDVALGYGGDMHRAASRVRARVLAVYSWDDHMVTPDSMAEFARMISADTLSVASVCGHVMVFCEQKRVGAATRAFIGR
ncbi:MAG: alpha/beta fold hydrolase [Gemmatimonadales bacterium]